MKKTLLYLFLFSAAVGAVAQQGESPVDHMNLLNEKEEALQKKYLSYISTLAHSKSARKMEKRRADVIAEIQTNIREGGRVRPHKGDVSLRTAYLDYWNLLLHIFREDYQKVVDLEAVAERSYDEMEAYVLLQEEIENKLNGAYKDVAEAYRAFAANHNVRLLSGGESQLEQKLKKAGQVSHYMNQLFLIYFKCYIQDNNLNEALSKGDIASIEQVRAALLEYSKEGLVRLDTIKPYNGDGSLVNNCRKVLQFYQDVAQNRVPPLADFLIKADEFKKIKESLEAIPSAKRTQADIDRYNDAVNEFNSMVPVYNKNSETLFNQRNKMIQDWENARKRFMDLHMPYK